MRLGFKYSLEEVDKILLNIENQKKLFKSGKSKVKPDYHLNHRMKKYREKLLNNIHSKRPRKEKLIIPPFDKITQDEKFIKAIEKNIKYKKQVEELNERILFLERYNSELYERLYKYEIL